MVEEPIGRPNDFASVALMAIAVGPNARLDEVEKIVRTSALGGMATSQVSA